MAPFFLPGASVEGGTPSGGVRRTEQPVGASPAVLPAGTHTLHVHVRGHGTPNKQAERWVGDIYVSDLAATDLDFNIDAHNPEQASRDNSDANNVIIRMRYTAATRQLTYSLLNTNNFRVVQMQAIGEA